MTLGGPIDFKNIGLAKLLYKLRQHLDVYCLVAVNQDKLNAISGSFFGHLRQTEIDAICLSICKIYEMERRFPLNSIPGVCQLFLLEDAKADGESAVRAFVAKYKGPSGHSAGIAVKLTAKRFLEERRGDLNRFKEFRDKQVAHSEYKIEIPSLPSYATMEKFFEFGADFYTLVSEAFLGIGAAELRRDAKVGFEHVLRKLGLSDLRTEML
jgi:hypothetical protein